jgi:hypothetical protein
MPPSILYNAETSVLGRPVMIAEPRSVANSRYRDSARSCGPAGQGRSRFPQARRPDQQEPLTLADDGQFRLSCPPDFGV